MLGHPHQVQETTQGESQQLTDEQFATKNTTTEIGSSFFNSVFQLH
jgi:hypothetical protein